MKKKISGLLGVLMYCSGIMTPFSFAVDLPKEKNREIQVDQQIVDVSHYPQQNTMSYQYTGSEWIDGKQLFQKNNTVYLRLAPADAMDAPGPLALPKKIGDLYIKNPGYLQGWYLHKYMRYVEEPYVQELRFDWYDSKKQYQGTATTMYRIP
ncbi:hypothetical protein P4377_26415 [Bacillus thuringiensis]|nr:hypothetical protein [Bacillus thuringiensis]